MADLERRGIGWRPKVATVTHSSHLVLPGKSWTTSTQDTPYFKIPFGLNLIHASSTHDRAHPPDSVHRCLNVDEILRLIACELVTSGTEATAVCLACCCKCFEDPVLDALWATQFSLSMLLKCLPGDVWGRGRYTPFKRFPTATEWARFRKYARRIRNFRYRSTPKTLSPEVRSVMQLYTINEPLLPNLTTLDFLGVEGSFIPFIPSFLSPRIITISFSFETPRCLPKSVIASLITKLPTRCPNLQDINLLGLPRGPMVTAAVSDLIFATNRNALRGFCVDSPLTEAASEVMYKLQNLRRLSVAIEKGNSIPSASLPSLTCLRIVCVDGSDGLQILRRATPGKLESVDFTIESEPVGDFLEAFKGVALSLSIQNTLSAIRLSAGRLWDPNYHILLPFTRLVDLYIQSVCAGSCSRVDDGIVIDLSRAMPKLQSLMLGDEPCHPFTGGVTTKGLVALAHNCPNLSSLRVHFQVAGLSDPSMGFETVRDTRYSASWRGCALTKLEVGWIPVSERSAPMVALTLLRIFPRIESIIFGEGNDKWGEIEDMICRSKQIVDRSRARFMTDN